MYAPRDLLPTCHMTLLLRSGLDRSTLPRGSRMARRNEPAKQRETGAAMIEFGLLALPLLLMSLLIIEAAHWQLVRQLAYVALLDGARAGATQHGRPSAIEQAFAHAFLPRFIHAGSNARETQRRNWERIQQRTDMPAWKIEVLQPDEAAFRIHAQPGLRIPGVTGRLVINNDFQAEQHARTPATHPDIFEANTLHVRLTYLHEPLTPLVRTLLRRIAGPTDNCARQAWSHGLLAMRLALRVEMHSHPVAWQETPPARHDKVIHGTWTCMDE
ncbi:TadE-like domain-containing protein [Bordetella tumulicola]